MVPVTLKTGSADICILMSSSSYKTALKVTCLFKKLAGVITDVYKDIFLCFCTVSNEVFFNRLFYVIHWGSSDTKCVSKMH